MRFAQYISFSDEAVHSGRLFSCQNRHAQRDLHICGIIYRYSTETARYKAKCTRAQIIHTHTRETSQPRTARADIQEPHAYARYLYTTLFSLFVKTIIIGNAQNCG